jgi:antitoxin ParD1/3/4
MALAYIANAGQERIMPTRNAVVTQAQATMIEDLIERGRFQNASEVIREGLRLVEAREIELEEVRERLKKGLAQIARGEARDGKEAINTAFERAKKRVKQGALSPVAARGAST